jgi:hypothetical protein
MKAREMRSKEKDEAKQIVTSWYGKKWAARVESALFETDSEKRKPGRRVLMKRLRLLCFSPEPGSLTA